MLCYVDHHDKAYDWAERRKLEIHPKTGAAQLVEIRETIQEIFVPVYVQQEKTVSKSIAPLFESISNEELLSYGVPVEWLDEVKQATDETIFEIADHLPAEASEALLELATGGKPPIQFILPKTEDPFKHPDAQRRFRTMQDAEELERALDFPWDKWTIFLHPAQRQWVERTFSGPAKIAGSAGTGKTIVALHKTVFLAKQNADARILLTTFSSLLANALKVKLKRLLSNELRLAEQMEIYPLNAIGLRLYKSNIGTPNILEQNKLAAALKEIAAPIEGNKFSQSFLLSEWQEVVDVWQLKSWEEYRDVKRLGRKTRLPEQQRAILWSIFQKLNDYLSSNSFITYNILFNQLAQFFYNQNNSPFNYIVVDEAQDVSVCQLRFIAAIGKNNNSLFFAGDLGQRIFQQPFSWKSLGVDVRGRSKTLTVNYRTSHQIRQQADKLLAPEVSDIDGNIEDRSKTVSVFNGPEPTIKVFQTESEECNHVAAWITAQLQKMPAHEIGIFVRSEAQLNRAIDMAAKVSIPFIVLDNKVNAISNKLSICTMHLAKGLEFKAVAIMACDDEVIPLQERIENITDTADLEDVYNTERHLLYVACTRARDCLLITSVEPASEFLDDLKMM